MNTHEEYVTYAQAKALKELGFDWPCRYRATKEDAPDGQYWNYPCLDELSNSELGSREFAIPTQAVVCKWLRDEHGLFIAVGLCAAGWAWYINKCGSYECNGTFVAKHDDESGDDEDSGLFTTYGGALSDGLDKALEILKTKLTSNK